MRCQRWNVRRKPMGYFEGGADELTLRLVVVVSDKTLEVMIEGRCVMRWGSNGLKIVEDGGLEAISYEEE
jgi:hypothetical protein